MEDGLRALQIMLAIVYDRLVLILVVMEDGLRVFCLSNMMLVATVLILVVMEDGLRDLVRWTHCLILFVLILVVMEDGLRGNLL